MYAHGNRWLLACLLGAAVVLAAGAGRCPAQQGKDAKAIPLKLDKTGPNKVDDKLTKDDRVDGQGQSFKTFAFQGQTGHLYRFHLTTKEFDPGLRLEDVNGKQLKNEDEGGGGFSRLAYRPSQNGTLHLIVTSFDRGKGNFSLETTVTEVKEPKLATLKLNKDKATQVEARLSSDDGTDLQGKFQKLYEFSTAPGKLYRFTATAKGFTPQLRLEDTDGKYVNASAAYHQNAMSLVLKADKFQDYRLVVAGSRPGETGDFQLVAVLTEAREPTAAAVQFEAVKQSRVADTLGEKDGIDPDGRFVKAYTFQGEAGKAYRVDLATNQFGPALQLLDDNGKLVRQVRGYGGSVRLHYKAKAPGAFRVLVTAQQPAAAGAFTLTITESAAKEAKAETVKVQAGKATGLQGSLTEEDDTDEQSRAFKEYPFEAEAGKAYRIEMHSPAFGPHLLLKDQANATLRQANYDGEPNKARLIFKAPNAGTYRIIAATQDGGGRGGAFTLTAAEANKLDLIQLQQDELFRLSGAEKKQMVLDLAEQLRGLKDGAGVREANLARQVTQNLMYDNQQQQLAQEAHLLLGKELAQARATDVARTGRQLLGIGKRLGLPGKEMVVKGKTVDGKDFDLAKLKGKVVLVDFWATWNQQCLAELPNVKRLYEKYHKDGFEVIGISLDDRLEPLSQFLKNQDIPWPSIYDKANGTDQELAEAYGATNIPLAILIGPDGRVVSMNARGQELDRLLRELLEKKK